jgi:hypothetical protein
MSTVKNTGSGNDGRRKIPKNKKRDFPSSLENAYNAFPTFPPPLLRLVSLEKGDISNEVRWGTFLTSYDTLCNF